METQKEEMTGGMFPVLLMEPDMQRGNELVYIPSHIAFHDVNDSTPGKVQIWHDSDTSPGEVHEWSYPLSSVRNISVNRRDNRGVLLYVVLKYSDDFHIFFSSEAQCKRFYSLVMSALSADSTYSHTLTELTDEIAEYEYELDEKTGGRVVLGRGAFGTVYSAVDSVTKKKMAVKEIRESDAGQFQALQEEIQLHRHLQHKNIVQYYGARTEDDVFKIFMENVPGGSLSSLLRQKWGPLKDDEQTIQHYTRQIVEGIKYLHDHHIVHRDIKGDNVLINMYTGVLKISDFGTSKRLAGLQDETRSFKGTLQFMAPEVIQSGQRGYGPPADIWSLGCTVVEMATGKPPFYDLGDPRAAIFVVVRYQRHPDIPESMSSQAKSFCESCFHQDPKLRVTATELLWHEFLAKRVRPDRLESVPARITSAIPGVASKSLTISRVEKATADYRRLKSTPVHSPETVNTFDISENGERAINADEPETLGAEDGRDRKSVV